MKLYHDKYQITMYLVQEFPFAISASDPCAAGDHDCHELANCIPGGPTGYRCECKVGYRGDGYSCEGTQVWTNVMISKKYE